MKFKAETIIEINDADLLEIVNEQQEWDDLEPFAAIEEVPMEIVWIALDQINYFTEELSDYVSPSDFEITLAE